MAGEVSSIGLTPDFLQRELAQFKDLLEARITGEIVKLAQFKDILEARITGEILKIEARLDAMDKALTKVELYPTEVDKAFQKLKELHGERMEHLFNLHEEKLKGIHSIFNERDKRAGLLEAAYKEARDKNETNLKKQLDAMESQISTVSRVLDNKIDDLRTRLQALEGRM